MKTVEKKNDMRKREEIDILGRDIEVMRQFGIIGTSPRESLFRMQSASRTNADCD